MWNDNERQKLAGYKWTNNEQEKFLLNNSVALCVCVLANTALIKPQVESNCQSAYINDVLKWWSVIDDHSATEWRRGGLLALQRWRLAIHGQWPGNGQPIGHHEKRRKGVQRNAPTTNKSFEPKKLQQLESS